MGLNFRKSIKIAPGVKLNFGKKSAGISLGGKYGGVSFNSRTGARARVSAPGTGLSYTTKLGGSKKTNSVTNGTSSRKNSTSKSGGCLMSCLKGIGFLILLPFGWIYGIYWLLVKRKKLDDDPELQKSKTFKTILLSIFSFLMLLYGACSPDSSNDAVISTELNTEYISSECVNTEVLTTSAEIFDTISTEVLTEIPTETFIDTENTEISTSTPVVETETPTETEAPVVAPVSTQAPSTEKEEVLVWIDDTAARYHKKNGCGMNNAYQVTLDEAIAKGKTPCGRCY